MFAVRGLCLLIPLVWLSLASLSLATSNISKPGCQHRCGNVTIPYPWGIDNGRDGACSLNEIYNVICNNTLNPPRPFLNHSRSNNFEVLEISIEGQHMLAKSGVAANHYENGQIVSLTPVHFRETGPLSISDSKNKLFTIGCDDYVVLGVVFASRGSTFRSGCITGCSNVSAITNGSCSGVGCCQTTIPRGLYFFTLDLGSFENHTQVGADNPYGYAFIGDPSKFEFNVGDLSDPHFVTKTIDSVPVVLEWYIWDAKNCEIAKGNKSTYACQDNSHCNDYVLFSGGYTCTCLPGYQEIDECASDIILCSHNCRNTLSGHYECYCPNGYYGDGWKCKD
uniref:EGF-like domain-containing protein n=1 Tax=Chenopodium quinoa TaxID=63459 RepID=A0A803KWP3_CHEQI